MIVGFSFRKVSAEKKSGVFGQVDISNNCSITSVQESELALGKQRQKGVSFNFEFTSSYSPQMGEIILSGEVLYLGDIKQNEDIIKGWEKTKTVPKEIMAEVMDAILTKCNIEAIILSRDISLPPPIPLPKVKVRDK